MFKIAIALVIVLVAVAYVYKSQILAFIDKVKLRVKEATPEDIETVVATPTPTTPVETTVELPKATAVDFSKYKGWASAEVLIHVLHRGYIGDEEQRARDAGVVFNDAPVVVVVENTGYTLPDGEVNRKPFTANVQSPAYSFTANKATQKFSFMGSPGAFFNQVSASITGADGVDYGSITDQKAFGVGTEWDVTLPAGNYNIVITVNGSGTLAVQYNQW